MTLIYVMCHRNPDSHWLQKWFEEEASKLSLDNITYKYIDNGLEYGPPNKADIKADIFAGNQQYQTADVVYVPDCGGAWHKSQDKGYTPGGNTMKMKFVYLITMLFEWVKDGGWLYVGKIMDLELEEFLLQDLGFEKRANTWNENLEPLTLYRKKKSLLLL